jgi:hypothetical protein
MRIQDTSVVLPMVDTERNLFTHLNLKSYITNYYKLLIGSPEEGNYSMDETRIDDIP